MNNLQAVVKGLIEARESAKSHEKGWKEEQKRIDSELASIIEPAEIAKAAGKDKTGGSKTVEMYGGKFTVDVEKKVSWDSAKLQAVAASLPWEMVEAIFKIKFEISETKYKDLVENSKGGMFDPEVLKKINDARTVEIGEAKIKAVEISTQT